MTWTLQQLLTWRLYRRGTFKKISKQAWNTQHSKSSSWDFCLNSLQQKSCLTQLLFKIVCLVCSTSSTLAIPVNFVHGYVNRSQAAKPFTTTACFAFLKDGAGYCKPHLFLFCVVIRHCHSLARDCSHLLVCCCSYLGCVQS